VWALNACIHSGAAASSRLLESFATQIFITIKRAMGLRILPQDCPGEKLTAKQSHRVL
jgi:hypothetical protein